MAWNMLQCIDSSDEFKLINSYLFVRLNPSLDPKRDRIVRSSNRNIKIILYIIIIPLFCIVINRFWLLIKFINPLLSLLLLQGTYLKYFHPTRRITIRSEREVHGTRKHCNHRFHTVAKLRFDAGWSVLRSCKYTSDRFLFESLPPPLPNVSWKSVECDSVLFALSKFPVQRQQCSTNRDQLFAIEFFNNISRTPVSLRASPPLPPSDNPGHEIENSNNRSCLRGSSKILFQILFAPYAI